jgi:hypothetical protein
LHCRMLLHTVSEAESIDKFKTLNTSSLRLRTIFQPRSSDAVVSGAGRRNFKRIECQ